MGARVLETGNGEHTEPDFDLSRELRECMMNDAVDDTIFHDDDDGRYGDDKNV